MINGDILTTAHKFKIFLSFRFKRL